jgi:hypothetical protein
VDVGIQKWILRITSQGRMEIPTNSQEALNLLPTNTQRPLISGMVPSREETLVSHTEYTNKFRDTMD